MKGKRSNKAGKDKSKGQVSHVVFKVYIFIGEDL